MSSTSVTNSNKKEKKSARNTMYSKESEYVCVSFQCKNNGREERSQSGLFGYSIFFNQALSHCVLSC